MYKLNTARAHTSVTNVPSVVCAGRVPVWLAWVAPRATANLHSNIIVENANDVLHGTIMTRFITNGQLHVREARILGGRGDNV
jgi:hypothetical protein